MDGWLVGQRRRGAVRCAGMVESAEGREGCGVWEGRARAWGR